MDRFSDRMGITVPALLQVDSLSPELRNSLWNVFHTIYDYKYWEPAARIVTAGFTRTRLDHVPETPNGCRDWLSQLFQGGTWYETYNLVEFLLDNHRYILAGARAPADDPVAVGKWLNTVLEKERSAYRFIGKSLAPISSEAEVKAIEEAASSALKHGVRGAEGHIRAAVKMMSLKPIADYRNAVKEAISAVESIAKLLAKDDKAMLTPALKALAAKTSIHPALQAGFINIYGYTSDAKGIRHAMLEEPTVDFAEAKYMVVSCSAFVHYLIQKGSDAGLVTV
jgi:hypothetical protein